MKIYTDDLKPEDGTKLRLGGREPRIVFGGLALLAVLIFLAIGVFLLIYSGFDWEVAGAISTFSLVFLLISFGLFLKIEIYLIQGMHEIIVDRNIFGVCVFCSRYPVENIREILVTHKVSVEHDYSGPEGSGYMEKMGKGKYKITLELDLEGKGWLRLCPILIDDVFNCRNLVLACVDFKDIAEAFSDRVKKIIGLNDCQQRYRYLFCRMSKPSSNDDEGYDS